MTAQSLDFGSIARANCATAAAAFSGLADYLRTIDDDMWDGPSACAKWTVRDLAGHALGEAVWFPNLIRGVTQGEDPLPMSVYDEMKSYSRAQIADALDDAAGQFGPALEGAPDEQVQQPVDLGFAKQPLWQATYISAFEAVFHGWDAQAIADNGATIPTDWAVHIGRGIPDIAPNIAHQKQLAGAAGTYLLRVRDSIGPVTVTVQNGEVRVIRDQTGVPDVTLDLDADQYDRLIAGRLTLDSELPRDRVTIDGDRERALALNRIFGGVANEE